MTASVLLPFKEMANGLYASWKAPLALKTVESLIDPAIMSRDTIVLFSSMKEVALEVTDSVTLAVRTMVCAACSCKSFNAVNTMGRICRPGTPLHCETSAALVARSAAHEKHGVLHASKSTTKAHEKHESWRAHTGQRTSAHARTSTTNAQHGNQRSRIRLLGRTTRSLAAISVDLTTLLHPRSGAVVCSDNASMYEKHVHDAVD